MLSSSRKEIIKKIKVLRLVSGKGYEGKERMEVQGVSRDRKS